jgi:hypothetical protein
MTNNMKAHAIKENCASGQAIKGPTENKLPALYAEFPGHMQISGPRNVTVECISPRLLGY